MQRRAAGKKLRSSDARDGLRSRAAIRAAACAGLASTQPFGRKFGRPCAGVRQSDPDTVQIYLPTVASRRVAAEMRRSTAIKAAAAALLLLLSLAAGYLSIMSYWERREEEQIHGMFVEYKARCSKTYNSTAGEVEYRYAVFKANFRRGHNVLVCIFGDMTPEELTAWEPGEVPSEEDILAEQRQQVVVPLVEEGRDGGGGAVSSY